MFIIVFSILFLIGKTLLSIVLIFYEAIKGWVLRARKVSMKQLKVLEKTMLANLKE